MSLPNAAAPGPTTDVEIDLKRAFDAALEVELAELTDEDVGRRVTAIGGGHGLAVALQAIRSYAGHVTGVVSVADDGGSSGRLTKGLGIPPPGDIRRCLLALTPEQSVWTELFGFRFLPEGQDGGSDVDGHSLGNLMIAALTQLRGGFYEAVVEAGVLLGAMGEVIPAADRPVHLSGVVGGRTVSGQAAISRARGQVERLFLGPDPVSARQEAVEAISRADQIVLGPGSLFTSTIAALLVPGVVEAIERSAAELVFVLNLVTQDGETLNMSGVDHLQALRHHTGLTRQGCIVANIGPLEVPDGLDRVDLGVNDVPGLGWTVESADLAADDVDWPAHDPAKLTVALARP